MPYSWTAPATFTDTTVYDAADLTAQITDNLAYLRQELPTRVMIWHRDQQDSFAGWTTVATASQEFNGYWHVTTPADGDTFTHPVVLAAGTYTMSILGITGANGGKIDWTLGGTTLATGQDWYSVGTVYNVVKTVSGIVVPTGGRYILAGTVNGKNVSSGGYYMIIISMSLKQAAD